MDSTKVWKANRKRYTSTHGFKYKHFGLFESNLETLSVVGYEKVVDQILKNLKTSPYHKRKVNNQRGSIEYKLSKMNFSKDRVLDLQTFGTLLKRL